LYAAEEGLAVVRALLRAVASRLKSGGAFLCEISSEQGVAAAGAARDAGYACVEILRDYTGRDRVLKCLRP
jgi:methylase of polypeptide subunit release factors